MSYIVYIKQIILENYSFYASLGFYRLCQSLKIKENMQVCILPSLPELISHYLGVLGNNFPSAGAGLALHCARGGL